MELSKRNRITEVLRKLEYMEEIKIIYACEAGSRAWGFESADSDYDIRFIYVRPANKYFSINPIRDVIDRNKGLIKTSKYLRSLEQEDLDFVGFDISKTLKLISQGNPALAEWLQSPIEYTKESFAVSAVQRLSEKFFKTKAGIYHYEHMARKNFNQYIKNVDGDVIIKKYLYVLRPLYACWWLMNVAGAPPMEFEKLIQHTNNFQPNEFVKIDDIVQDLIKRKKEGEELGCAPRIERLDKFCEKHLDLYKEHAEALKVHEMTNEDYERIDSMFFTIVCK